jgi:hypothetical protein
MRTIVALFILLAAASSAVAQAPDAQPKNREEFMQKILQLALENVQTARCGNEACKPATDAEKKNPPLSLTETSQIVGRGIFSGGAQFCGLDWQKRNFEPMMTYWRTERKKNERQLAVISIIHGIMQEQIRKTFAEKGTCPPEIKKDLETKIDFKV